MPESNLLIRRLKPKDNAAIANILRCTLEEFNAHEPGTAYYDESTDHLSDVFTKEGSYYFVVEQDGHLLGGAGIYPTEGLPGGVCELVKMYLLPAGRGTGLGKEMMKLCLDKAKELGYTKVYLESMPQLVMAIPMYEKFGFEYLKGPLGNSGHFACTIHMLKQL